MGDRLRASDGSSNRARQFVEGLSLKVALKLAWFQVRVFKYALCREVTIGCVMLMQRVHGNALRSRTGSLSQARTKGIMRFVRDAYPIDGTQHYRLSHTQ